MSNTNRTNDTGETGHSSPRKTGCNSCATWKYTLSPVASIQSGDNMESATSLGVLLFSSAELTIEISLFRSVYIGISRVHFDFVESCSSSAQNALYSG